MGECEISLYVADDCQYDWFHSDFFCGLYSPVQSKSVHLFDPLPPPPKKYFILSFFMCDVGFDKKK